MPLGEKLKNMKNFCIAVIHFHHLFLKYLFNRTCSEAQFFNIMVSISIFTSDIWTFLFDNLLMLSMHFAYFLFSRVVLLFYQCSFSFQEGQVPQTVKFSFQSEKPAVHSPHSWPSYETEISFFNRF